MILVSSIALSFLVALVASWGLLRIIMCISYHYGYLDCPNERSSHADPVPRLGGLAFLPSVVLATAVGWVYLHYETGSNCSIAPSLQYLLVAAVLLYLVGLFDDLWGLTPLRKLLGQLMSAFFLARSSEATFGYIPIVSAMPTELQFGVMIGAIVLVLNAFNLIDGVDGLAAALCVCSIFFYAFVLIYGGNEELLVYLLIVASVVAVLLPFLYYNVWGLTTNRTKIFMGDTGALTLSAVICYLALLPLTQEGLDEVKRATLVSMGIAPLLLPVLDTLRLFIYRLYKRRSPFSADHNHIHHYLLDLGCSHTQTRMLLLLVAGLIGGVHIFFAVVFDPYIALLPDVICYLGVVKGILYVKQHRCLTGRSTRTS